MRACALAAFLVPVLAMNTPAESKARKSPLPPARIAALVRQLGDDSFEMREAASRALKEAGEPALPGLRKAAASDDPEVRRRAGALTKAIMREVHSQELKKLQGAWALCGLERGGEQEKLVLAAVGLPARFDVRPAQPVFKHPTISSPDVFTVTLIDASRGSGKVDFSCGELTYECLYRVEGERLSLTWPEHRLDRPAPEAGHRPPTLKTRPGASHYVMTFERPRPPLPSPEPSEPARVSQNAGWATAPPTTRVDPLGPRPVKP